MIAKAVYLICVPLLVCGVAVVLAAGAALVMPPDVMRQAAVVAPMTFMISASVLAHFLGRYVIPEEQQGPQFRLAAFWGSVLIFTGITGLFLGTAYFGLVTLIEGMVISLGLVVVGQYGLIRYLQAAPMKYDVFD